MSETPQERAQRFFDELPEPDGTLDEVMEAARLAAWVRMNEKWGVNVEGDPS